MNPGGNANGDLVGIKATETGNNSTKLHIYRNFTYENQDLDRLVIDASGKIGIGTSSPSELLDVDGNIKVSSNKVISANRGRIGFSHVVEDWNHTIYNNYQNIDNEGAWDGMKFNGYKGASFRVGSSKTTALHLDDLSRVGIGTSAPNRNLHVYGANAGNGNVLASIMIGKSNGPEIQSIQQSNDDDIQGLAFRVKSSSTSANPNFEAMRINSSGSVGIGTTSTGSHKLAVHGSIGAREIKVEANSWSDFVFEDDYDLRTLEEVEQHINEKGHLPEIPNEAEVSENGINLGAMDAKLLQKIEELTLYVIDLNKRVQELENENQELRDNAMK